MALLRSSLLELVSETSTNLPSDVRASLTTGAARERTETRSGQALRIIAKNIDMARAGTIPICQDTGMPTFRVRLPATVSQKTVHEAIEWAVAEATRLGRLRPNSVDSITGRNSGENLGPGTPVVHFEVWDQAGIEVMLILKGGGCENKSAQYSLPCELPGVGRAERSLEGVYRCILHSVHAAQGQGCSIGYIGVCVGGDRAGGYTHAKEQLFRSLDDTNPEPELADLEARVLRNADGLGVGAMGFGGDVTLLGCKIGAINRVPASFFVSVAYNCWAFRRMGVRLDAETGEVVGRLFRDEAPAPMADPAAEELTGREVRLQLPLTEEAVRGLHVGDVVLLNGPAHTGRDALHKHLSTHDSPVDLSGGAIYHCGPVMLRSGEGWRVVAAGPTTSSREEPYQAGILRRFGVRAVIGKGGMGQATSDALQEVGAVYLNAIGGAAAYYADRIVAVTGVDYLDEFGVPEAMWHLELKDFPAVVTMDAHGGSLHSEIERLSLGNLPRLAAAP